MKANSPSMLTSEFMHVICSALICSTCKFADIQVNAGMADYQHVVPVHAAHSRKRKRSDVKNDYEHLGRGTFFSGVLYFVDYKFK